MEIFFDIILFTMISVNLLMNFSILKAINHIDFDNHSRRNNLEILHKNIGEDIDLIERNWSKISMQMDALPDIIKEQNYRTLLALRESLEPAKPIKTNNWDSMREAFKTQVKGKESERDRA